MALVMIGFWVVVTGTRDDEPYETGIVEAGADPWMTGLLIVLLLLAVPSLVREFRQSSD